ncbi:MAG: Dam family site-specific DNA-(adenine-N6)-methyltransferase [Gammaproteobacteria bacterium]
MKMGYTRPFLKWPGGKYRALNLVLPHFPKSTTLVEPFVGAGAIFLNTHFSKYMLNDLNHHLIQVYAALSQHKNSFIEEARLFFDPKHNHAKQYYLHRNTFNSSTDLFKKSAIFMFLNRHGYNGLCRFNQKGHYNVPFGHYPKAYFPEKEMHHFLTKQNVCFSSDSFEAFFKRLLRRKSLVNLCIYCDPPYAPLSNTAKFTNYTGLGFTLDQQILLAELAQMCRKKGAHVLISNHDTPFTRRIYEDAQLVRLELPRLISCKANQRQKVNELLAIYAP